MRDKATHLKTLSVGGPTEEKSQPTESGLANESPLFNLLPRHLCENMLFSNPIDYRRVASLGLSLCVHPSRSRAI